MKRTRIPNYILFFLCTLLLLVIAPAIQAQDTPTGVEITWVDTSQFPQIEVHLVATRPDSGRFGGLFVDALQLTEDGTPRDPSMYDAPRGTSVTFLIDADQVAEAHWEQIRQAVESYVSLTENWMDEDLDTATVVVATGEEWKPLVENTPFRNDVFNAFITDSGAYYRPQFRPLTLKAYVG